MPTATSIRNPKRRRTRRPSTPKVRLAVLAKPIALEAADDFTQGDVQIMPPGRVELADGEHLIVTEGAADRLVKAFKAHGVDLPVDLDHATVYRAPKGQAAPAVGWVKSLSFNSDRGIVGSIDWTSDGAGYVHDRQYKYLSPVVFYDESSREVLRLHSVGLTNKPAIQHAEALKAASEALSIEEIRTMADVPVEGEVNPVQLIGEIKVLLEQQGAEIGENASENEILMAVKKMLMGEPEGGEGEGGEGEGAAVAHLRGLVGLPDDAKPEEVVAMVEKLKDTADDAGGADNVKALTERLTKVEGELAEATADELMRTAHDARKINPNDEKSVDYWRAKALKDPADFAAAMAVQPVVGPPQGVKSLSTGTPKGAGEAEDVMIQKATADHKGDFAAGMEALQTKLLSEHQTETGAGHKAAVAACTERFPKIFGRVPMESLPS